MAIDLLEFRRMCQFASAYGFENVPKQYLVIYDGKTYIPYMRQERFVKGEPVNVGVIKDMCANSYVHVNLEVLTKSD